MISTVPTTPSGLSIGPATVYERSRYSNVAYTSSAGSEKSYGSGTKQRPPVASTGVPTRTSWAGSLVGRYPLATPCVRRTSVSGAGWGSSPPTISIHLAFSSPVTERDVGVGGVATVSVALPPAVVTVTSRALVAGCPSFVNVASTNFSL